jgi:drug/metabolite transporter (DMT)-like permease
LGGRDLNYYRKGFLFAFVGSVCGGVLPTLNVFMLKTTGPEAVASLVFVLSGVMLIPYKPRKVPKRTNLSLLVATGVLGAALAPVLYLNGLELSTAVNASLLSNGEVFFTSVIAFLAFNERLERDQLLEGLLIVAGIFVVSTNLDFAGVQLRERLVGNILILSATVCWSLENNLTRIASQRYGAVFVTKYRNILGGILLLGIVLVFSLPVALPVSALVPLTLLVIATAVTSLLFIAALARIGAVRTLLVFSSTSIFGAISALVFLREQITAAQVLGAAVILLGVYLIQRSEKRVPEELSTSKFPNQTTEPMTIGGHEALLSGKPNLVSPQAL